ncbi:unnamed protein product [Camellia sinensis]
MFLAIAVEAAKIAGDVIRKGFYQTKHVEHKVDVAGGAVIVTEAGGVIFDPSGKEFDITAQRVAASNPLLKDKFVEAFRQSE